MRTAATFAQLAGLAGVIVAGVFTSTEAAILAVSVVLVFVGLAMERN